MNRADLVRAIEEAIGVLAPVYRNRADESDLYEASLLSVCVDAVTAAGGTTLLTEDGQTPSQALRFRRSPGVLASSAFTYGMASFPGTPKMLEIHLGVYVLAGVSKVPHECDVAMIENPEAERSRRTGVYPRSRGLIAAVEAKHYDASPSLGIGRGFLGFAREMGEKKCSLVFPSKTPPTSGR
ncbi:hypothetical protein [Nocardia gipuzkoensis]|uniref:hypothetical protein n=1 Tax=Nocardia gipuzkoensis TaxID=2749991 RepID=UPI003EE0E559